MIPSLYRLTDGNFRVGADRSRQLLPVSAVWKPLLSRPPVESCVNAGLDSMAEASAVNYRMFVVFEVWPTGFAQPLWTHRVLGHLCSSMLYIDYLYSPIILHGRRLSHTPQIDSCDCV